MRKLLWLIVCLMTMVVSANAQNLLKIKQVALNECKSNLYAPAHFVLTDTYGNRISVSQIPTTYHKAYVSLDSIYFYNQDVIDYVGAGYKVLDSVGVRKVHHLAHYVVKITGEGMVLAGGYKQMNKWYYVTPTYEVLEKEPITKENGYTIVRKIGEKDRSEEDLRLLNAAKNAKENGEFVIGYGKVYDSVEEMPSFVGGHTALMDYLNNNVNYPIVAYENGVQGRVIVSFVVEKDGSLSNIKVIKSIDPSLDKEAVRVVKSMPRWIAGRQNGRFVRVKYNVPISFRLENANRVKFKKYDVEEMNKEIERLRNQLYNDNHTSTQVFNTEGNDVTEDYIKGKTGIYIVNGKKIIIQPTNKKNDKVSKHHNDDVYRIR